MMRRDANPGEVDILPAPVFVIAKDRSNFKVIGSQIVIPAWHPLAPFPANGPSRKWKSASSSAPLDRVLWSQHMILDFVATDTFLPSSNVYGYILL